MQIVFTFDRLILMHLVLGLFAFWMGLRDLLGKDPLIHTFSTSTTAIRNTVPCGRRKTASFSCAML